jgi:hypothetical protein
MNYGNRMVGSSPIPLDESNLIPSITAMSQMLRCAGLLNDRDIPQPEATRAFLEASRAEAMTQLFRSWESSSQFNEIRMLASLTFEGNWQNDPLKARRTILALLKEIRKKPGEHLVLLSMPSTRTIRIFRGRR